MHKQQSKFDLIAKREQWFNTGRVIKDQEVGIGRALNALQAQFITDAHNCVIDELTQRITELESQMPKFVKPENISVYESGEGWWIRSWSCPSCKIRKSKGTEQRGKIPEGDKFCSCGAKLDWSGITE
jgi:hypothetical protein